MLGRGEMEEIVLGSLIFFFLWARERERIVS
jgi:hypothetical protein